MNDLLQHQIVVREVYRPFVTGILVAVRRMDGIHRLVRAEQPAHRSLRGFGRVGRSHGLAEFGYGVLLFEYGLSRCTA